jgi:hypothetical protein
MTTMRHATLLLLALAACGGSPKPADAPPPAAAEPVAPATAAADDELVVDDRGAEPRQELRYRAAAGTRREVSMTIQTGTVADGKATPSPPATIPGTIEVLDVSGDGVVTLRSAYDGMEARTARHDAHGRVLDDAAALAQSGGVVGMGVDLQQFPAIAVGPGARWTVRGVQPNDDGDTVTTTTRVELVGIDGDRVRVRFESDVTTAPSTARSHAEGEGSIDLVTLACDVAYGVTVETLENGKTTGATIFAAELTRR